MSQRDVHEVQDMQNVQDIQSPAESQKKVQGMEGSGEAHKMSIALTIGATIGLIGLVIMLYGLFGSADFSRSDGINIDLWWGLAMLVFGVLMAVGGYIAARRAALH